MKEGSMTKPIDLKGKLTPKQLEKYASASDTALTIIHEANKEFFIGAAERLRELLKLHDGGGEIGKHLAELAIGLTHWRDAWSAQMDKNNRAVRKIIGLSDDQAGEADKLN
jgi:hypothetical protein